MKIVSEEKDNRGSHDQALAKLLEAAYVLQEHRQQQLAAEPGAEPRILPAEAEPPIPAPVGGEPAVSPPATASNDDYTPTLAQIVETQHQIHAQHLDLEGAMALVAERATRIARAGGAAIGLVEGDKVCYRAATGLMAPSIGSEVHTQEALCTASLRTGEVIRGRNVALEVSVGAEECGRRGIQAMIVVPVYRDGKIVGALELYYGSASGFAEQDVHTCQLMAGLVTEALAQDQEHAWKKSLAAERAAMLEALEKLQPNLAALVDAPPAEQSAARNANAKPTPPEPDLACRKCGHQFLPEEQFCGKCGSPRRASYEPPSMQSKVASLWHMQETLKSKAAAISPDGASRNGEALGVTPNSHQEAPSADLTGEELVRLVTMPRQSPEEAALSARLAESAGGAPPEEPTAPNLALPFRTDSEENNAHSANSFFTKLHPGAWGSAAATRDYLEGLAPSRGSGALARFWNARRGDVYLALALILVACVIRWGIWSNPSVGATGNAAAAAHRKSAPGADLSLFDRLLVKLGVAEAPEPQEYKGNPDTQVWVDLRTALYYCPGTDLYGKTPKGKLTSQRDAQLDHFEPATRKACN